MAFVSDTFTDADGTDLASHTGELGATWTKFVGDSTGNSWIQANRAVENGGSHALYEASGTPATAEYDVEVPWYIASNLGNSGHGGRKQSGATTWYFVLFNGTAVEFYKVIAGTYTLLGSYTLSPTVGSVYTVKMQIRDAAKKIFIDGTERISSTDSSITTAGKAGIRLDNSTTTTGIHAESFTATDVGGSAFTVSLAGAISPTGALAKLLSKPFTGSVSPSGALSLIKVAVIALAGSISPTGALQKTAGKGLAGSTSPTGALAKAASKAYAGAITPTGALAKRVAKSLAGSITPAGALGRIVGAAIVAITSFFDSPNPAEDMHTNPSAGRFDPPGPHF